MSADPGEGALDDPPFGQILEAGAERGAPPNDRELGADVSQRRAGLPASSSSPARTTPTTKREDVPRRRRTSGWLRPDPEPRRSGRAGDRQAEDVDEGSLRPFTSRPASQPIASSPLRTFAPLFHRLDRPTVDDAGRGVRPPSLAFAKGVAKLFPDRFEDAFAPELAEDVVDGPMWRNAVGRQGTPGRTGAQQDEDRVHGRSHVGLAPPPTGGRAE